MKKIMILTAMTLMFGVSELDAQQIMKFKSSSGIQDSPGNSKIFSDELDGTFYSSKAKRFNKIKDAILIDDLDPRGIFKDGSRDKITRGFIYDRPNKRSTGCIVR